MSDVILKVGEKGEIYTAEALRKKVGIRKGGKVRAMISGDKLVIEPVPSIEELIRAPLISMTAVEAERLSEEAQEEEGAYG